MSAVPKSSSASKPAGREEEITERRTLRDYYIILRERDIHAVAAQRIEASTGLYL